MRWRTILAAVLGTLVGFGVAVVIQNLIEAKGRSWAKRTAADCVAISTALEKYRADHGAYPPPRGDVALVAQYLTPRYLPAFPLRDLAGNPYFVVSNGDSILVVALGSGGLIAENGYVKVAPHRLGRHISSSK